MRSFFTWMFLLALPGVAVAQSESAEEPAPACSVPAIRGVEFLVGEWQVTVREPVEGDGTGWQQNEGSSTWARRVEGCAFLEQRSGWLRGKPVQEMRLLAYDRRDEKWELALVDSAHGNLTVVSGRATENGLVFTSPLMRKGRLLVDRETIVRNGANSFSWTLETSSDGGATWRPLFVAKFTPRVKQPKR